MSARPVPRFICNKGVFADVERSQVGNLGASCTSNYPFRPALSSQSALASFGNDMVDVQDGRLNHEGYN